MGNIINTAWPKQDQYRVDSNPGRPSC